MLQSGESETDIVLGNKQIAGIFLVIAVLLGVAFTGGYMVGSHRPPGKASAATTDTSSEASSTAAPGNTATAPSSRAAASGGQTHTVGAEETEVLPPSPSSGEPEKVLGARKSNDEAAKLAKEEPASAASGDTEKATPAMASYTPRPGTRYLQVAAVSRDEAVGVADVLHKKGFRAHAVPKPGNTRVYRVIVGPIRDAGDLSSTRDALRRTGFREVIVQNY